MKEFFTNFHSWHFWYPCVGVASVCHFSCCLSFWEIRFIENKQRNVCDFLRLSVEFIKCISLRKIEYTEGLVNQSTLWTKGGEFLIQIHKGKLKVRIKNVQVYKYTHFLWYQRQSIFKLYLWVFKQPFSHPRGVESKIVCCCCCFLCFWLQIVFMWEKILLSLLTFWFFSFSLSPDIIFPFD